MVTTGSAAVASKTVGGGPVGSPCSVNSINKTKSIPSNQQARLALTESNPTQGNYYSGGGGGSLVESNSAYSNYNGVTFTAQHRFSTSYSIVANYTWSKCLDNTDPQGDISGSQLSNPNKPFVDYGPCGSDIRNNTNIYMVLRSKFPIHGFTGYLVNNWELAPLLRIVTSTPVNISEGQDESFTANGGDRPNLVPGVNTYKKTKIRSNHGGAVYASQSWLNQAAFVLNTVPGTQGGISRNSFRGPIYFQNDAQISRIFPLHEQFKLDLRLEAFNFLNHPSFSHPNSGGPGFVGGSFGEITGTSVGGRVFQGAVKLSF